MQIFNDAKQRPKLFMWYGQPPPAQFETWLREYRQSFPADLIEFWRLTGGGDVFESESILGPLSVPEWGDSLADYNNQLQTEGLPPDLIAIHVGVDVTAIDRKTLQYVVLDRRSFKETTRYDSFDDWYMKAIRAEHAPMYGI